MADFLPVRNDTAEDVGRVGRPFGSAVGPPKLVQDETHGELFTGFLLAAQRFLELLDCFLEASPRRVEQAKTVMPVSLPGQVPCLGLGVQPVPETRLCLIEPLQRHQVVTPIRPVLAFSATISQLCEEIDAALIEPRGGVVVPPAVVSARQLKQDMGQRGEIAETLRRLQCGLVDLLLSLNIAELEEVGQRVGELPDVHVEPA